MFRTPNEVTQTQLETLRVSMVDAIEESATLFPVFDDEGNTRYILVDTAGRLGRDVTSFDSGCLFVVEEFPLEIRVGKAIYARPMTEISPAASFPAAKLKRLWHLDPWDRLLLHPELPEETVEFLKTRNVRRLRFGAERIDDICFSLNLRKVSGAATRKSFFRRWRLEFPALKGFLEQATLRLEEPSEQQPESEPETEVGG